MTDQMYMEMIFKSYYKQKQTSQTYGIALHQYTYYTHERVDTRLQLETSACATFAPLEAPSITPASDNPTLRGLCTWPLTSAMETKRKDRLT